MAGSVGKCEPRLHGGMENTPDSEWYVSEAIADDTNDGHEARFVRVAMGHSFAGCIAHLPEAIAHVFSHGAKYAVIRRDVDLPIEAPARAVDRGPLTSTDVRALATIVDAAESGKHVRWANGSGDVLAGTARALARDGGGFPSSQEDVRDVCLHVSGITETWLPVVDVMRMLGEGMFAVDD